MIPEMVVKGFKEMPNVFSVIKILIVGLYVTLISYGSIKIQKKQERRIIFGPHLDKQRTF